MNGTAALLAVPSFLLLVVDIVALILVITGVRGRGRSLAAVGVVLQMVTFLTSTFFSLMLNRVAYRFALGSLQMEALVLIVNLVTSAIVASGLVMIGLAIAPRAARSAGRDQRPRFDPQAGAQR